MSEWKVNKDINLGEIITIVVVAGTFLAAMVGFFILQDRRIEGNTVGMKNNNEKIINLESGQAETRNRIESLRLENKSDMNRLDNKLDDIKDLIIKESKR